MTKLYRSTGRQISLFNYFSFLSLTSEKDDLFSAYYHVDFEQWRSITEAAVEKSKPESRQKKMDDTHAGRPAMDPVFMLKCLFEQRIMARADQAFEVAMHSNLFLQRYLCIEDPKDVVDGQAEKTLP